MNKGPIKLTQDKIMLWNVKQASEALNIPSTTLYSWVSQRMIPYVKVGRCLRFDPKDIKAWIESQKVDIADWRKK